MWEGYPTVPAMRAKIHVFAHIFGLSPPLTYRFGANASDVWLVRDLHIRVAGVNLMNIEQTSQELGITLSERFLLIISRNLC